MEHFYSSICARRAIEEDKSRRDSDLIRMCAGVIEDYANIGIILNAEFEPDEPEWELVYEAVRVTLGRDYAAQLDEFIVNGDTSVIDDIQEAARDFLNNDALSIDVYTREGAERPYYEDAYIKIAFTLGGPSIYYVREPNNCGEIRGYWGVDSVIIDDYENYIFKAIFGDM